MLERLLPLFQEDGINKLNNATVAVVGVGGVGGICAITLARSGVGTIIIQDYDTVEESNINRQVVANYNTIGKSKVDVLYNQIKEINPNCKLIYIGEGYGGCTADDDFHNNVHMVKDPDALLAIEHINMNLFKQFDGIHDEVCLVH